MATFAQYPKYSLHVARPAKLPPGYPVELRSIGDHIRKRRLDLGLLQIEVAAQIGVTENTVWNWEHGTEPELIHIPAVLTFLGYVLGSARLILLDAWLTSRRSTGCHLSDSGH